MVLFHTHTLTIPALLFPFCSTTWLLSTVIGSGKPCLLVGESGTAKSVTIAAYLASMESGANIVLNINFSSRTSSHDVQRTIEDSTEKRTKVGTVTDLDVSPIVVRSVKHFGTSHQFSASSIRMVDPNVRLKHCVFTLGSAFVQ